MKNLKEAQNAMWLIGGKVSQMILSLLVSVLTARYLGPNNYGLINYGLAYTSFFMAFCTLGINSVIIKDFVDNPKDEGKTIGTTIFLRAISSFLSAIMIILISGMLDKDEPLTICVVAICSISLVFYVFDTINYWFQSKYNSKITAIVTFAAYFIVSVYKIVLLMCKTDVKWFAFSTALDYILIGIFLYIAYRKHRGPTLSVSFKKGKELLSKSYHYILSGLMVSIYGQTDKLMLKHMLDESSVGFYSVAVSISGMWVFVLSAIIDSIYPTILTLYKENKKEYERKNKQLYAIVFYLSLFVSLGIVLLGDIAIKILYGNEYILASMPLKIITFYTAFSYLGVARNAWIVCEGQQKYLKYMYLSAAVINVILNFILIPIYGTVGAASASLITQICTSIILPFFFKGTRRNSILMLEAIMLKDVFSKKEKSC